MSVRKGEELFATKGGSGSIEPIETRVEWTNNESFTGNGWNFINTSCWDDGKRLYYKAAASPENGVPQQISPFSSMQRPTAWAPEEWAGTCEEGVVTLVCNNTALECCVFPAVIEYSVGGFVEISAAYGTYESDVTAAFTNGECKGIIVDVVKYKN